MLRAVCISQARHLCEQVDVVRASCAKPGNRKMLEDVQHLQDMNPAGTRWRHCDNIVATVSTVHRAPRDGSVGRKRRRIDETVTTLHLCNDLFGNFPLVERIGSLLGDELQSAGEIFLHE